MVSKPRHEAVDAAASTERATGLGGLHGVEEEEAEFRTADMAAVFVDRHLLPLFLERLFLSFFLPGRLASDIGFVGEVRETF
jgi:hypothetical protein